MPTLILSLPLAAAGTPEYDYVLTPDGQQVTAHGHTAAAMLPAQAGRSTEVVAVIPAAALSWHRIALPEPVMRGLLAGRLESARARGVLTGVLEEQLLDDTENLHFAIFAADASEPGATPQAWVVVCDRAWIKASLQALESAGHPVARIAAECTPQSSTARAFLSTALPPAQLLLCTVQGVSLLPLCAASVALALAQPELEVWAEPAVMDLAEQHFGARANLQTMAEHLLLAAQSPWNLAQLELSASTGGRIRKHLATAWQQVLHSPPWRPARWALVAMVLVQIVGLNAQAWKQSRLLSDKRAASAALLKQSFPDVQLVVDAPLQMQRAVDNLASARGVGSDTDFARVASVIGPLLPTGVVLSNIDLSSSQLRLGAIGLDEALAHKLDNALQAHGLRARMQDGQLLVEPRETR